jgi:hypothetical protein
MPRGEQVRLRASRDGFEPLSRDLPVGGDHLNTLHMRRRP